MVVEINEISKLEFTGLYASVALNFIRYNLRFLWKQFPVIYRYFAFEE